MLVLEKKIVPGNRLYIKAELKSYNRGLAKGVAVGYVDNEVACQVELVVAIPEIMNAFMPK